MHLIERTRMLSTPDKLSHLSPPPRNDAANLFFFCWEVYVSIKAALIRYNLKYSQVRMRKVQVGSSFGIMWLSVEVMISHWSYLTGYLFTHRAARRYRPRGHILEFVLYHRGRKDLTATLRSWYHFVLSFHQIAPFFDLKRNVSVRARE